MVKLAKQRWYIEMVRDGFTPQIEVAKQNWTTAVHTYRAALTAYHRLIESQQDRAVRVPVRRPLPVPAFTRILPSPPRLDGLTRREREVAELIARGFTNQQIAETLVLTRGTVANHVAHILGKVGVTNRTQIAARVLEAIAQPKSAPPPPPTAAS
jgi:DNA-binding NarL/FixJ family response regulator